MTEQTPEELRNQLLNAPEAPPVDPGTDAPPRTDDGRGGDGQDGGGDPDLVEIFPGSAVIPLGVSGEISWYLDVQGQLRGIDNHTAQKMLHVFGGRIAPLARHFPQFDKDGIPRPGKFDQTALSVAMMHACDQRGVWTPTNKVRGAGFWRDDDDRLILHAGHRVLIDGKWHPPGIYQGKIYTADDHMPQPADKIGRIDPAPEVLKMVESWHFRRPDIDPMLTLGSICAQMLGGALDWRPVTWLTGDQGTGKSSLQKLLLHLHGGTAGLKQSTNATEAGIRSVLGHSCLPVSIDELEADEDPRGGRAKGIIELARVAASGGEVFRGSSDQKGNQSAIYSCFILSSILVPPMKSQDRARLIQLDLDRLPDGAVPPNLDPRRLRALGAGLRRRLIEGWQTWPDRLHLWRAALSAEGHGSRGTDNFGTVMALADMVLHDDLPDQNRLGAWATKMGKAIIDETTEIGSDADDMVNFLLGQPYDVYRRGERFTVGQFVMAAAQLPGAPSSLSGSDSFQEKTDKADLANQMLAKAGLRVRGTGDGAELFFPNLAIPNLCDLFKETRWANGVWAQSSKRLPDAVPVPSPLTLAGQRTRGVYVPVRQLAGLVSFPATKNAMPPSGGSTFPGEEFTAEDF